MLIQSLLLLATLIVIGSALLTSTLVTAKAVFHQDVMMKSQTAMIDATADFVAWAQKNVQTSGLNQTSVWSAKAQQEPLQSFCVRNVPAEVTSQTEPCKLFEKIAWNVTGYTGDVPGNNRDDSLSEANQLATAQDEQRISATINVAVTDASGQVVYASHSREYTARLFHAFPYVAITASKDVSSQSGGSKYSEGDTGGQYSDFLKASAIGTLPSAITPAAYTNTIIETTVNCANTPQNVSRNPLLDDVDVKFAPVRSYGNLAWSYEAPCNPAEPAYAGSIPTDYVTPYNNVYKDQSTLNMTWQKRDENASSFGR